MSASKKEDEKGEKKAKPLRFDKEIVKDLSAKHGERVKGGVPKLPDTGAPNG